MAKQSEPQITEVEISATAGGQVQIVKFNLQNEFSFGYTERYSIPADWDQERFEEWKERKTAEIKAKLDEQAQVEQDAMLASSDWYRD